MSIVEREQEVAVPVTKRDVLHRAADLLEEFGWCVYVPAEREDGTRVSVYARSAVRFCAAGAITRAADDLGYKPPGPDRAWFDSKMYANTEWAQNLLGRNIWKFNDAPGRTKTEVVQRLREAAERAS